MNIGGAGAPAEPIRMVNPQFTAMVTQDAEPEEDVIEENEEPDEEWEEDGDEEEEITDYDESIQHMRVQPEYPFHLATKMLGIVPSERHTTFLLEQRKTTTYGAYIILVINLADKKHFTVYTTNSESEVHNFLSENFGNVIMTDSINQENMWLRQFKELGSEKIMKGESWLL